MRLLLLGLAGLLAGCSSFERDWRAAAALPAAADPLLGRWEGTWRSEVNGHHGGLRAIITRDAAGVYQARYRATYASLFSFEHSLPMKVEREGGGARFEGSADLGWLAGGVYTYAGQAGEGRYTSTYRSKHDHGLFELQRSEGPEN
jgi:hypothetical protein